MKGLESSFVNSLSFYSSVTSPTIKAQSSKELQILKSRIYEMEYKPSTLIIKELMRDFFLSVDLPEVKGSHRKFRTVVASLIGENITGNLTVFLSISSIRECFILF